MFTFFERIVGTSFLDIGNSYGNLVPNSIRIRVRRNLLKFSNLLYFFDEIFSVEKYE